MVEDLMPYDTFTYMRILMWEKRTYGSVQLAASNGRSYLFDSLLTTWFRFKIKNKLLYNFLELTIFYLYYL